MEAQGRACAGHALKAADAGQKNDPPNSGENSGFADGRPSA